VVALALTLLWPAAVASAVPDPTLPDPLQGPGHPELKRRDAKRLGKGITALREGDLDDASEKIRKASDSPARRLLELQLRMSSPGNEMPLEDLERLCADEPSYAAAWITFAVAAERAGAEATALQAAARGADLWPSSPWGDLEESLRQRWVHGRVAEARELAANGQPEAALELLEPALALDPSDHDALFAKADVLVDLDRADEADSLLLGMGSGPEVTLRRASIAERRGNLTAAMALYSAIPPGEPERDRALERVQLEWRRQNLPSYVQQALSSEDLTRADLAALLVGLVPEAHAIGGGQVPVLSDIVELPSQLEILTAVRIGLLQTDRAEHLFHPTREVDPDETRHAINRLCNLLGRSRPEWCGDDESPAAGCVELSAPVSGPAVADVVLQLARGEAP
jgi:tetratricopeptide (TPR) repeat protein